MRPLALADILDLDAYERVRPDYRQRVLAHKRDRRIAVGPQVTLLFEDRETLRYQIQEMTRVEQTTRPDKVQLEIDVYNDLIPGPDELSATLFIEIPDLDQIQPALDRLVGIDEHVSLVLGEDERIPARFDTRQMEEDRISAVHYLRFSLTPEQAERFRSGPPPRLRIDHPHYAHETELSEDKRASLARDLSDETPVLLDVEAARDGTSERMETLIETPTVRAIRHSGPGGRERFVVAPVRGDLSLAEADPALLAELFEVSQRVARELQGRAEQVRVRLDGLAGEAGDLRFEITALG